MATRDRQPAALGTQPTPGEGSPGVEDVLDAALAEFEDVGIRRSTIEDIARRAGIDRVTVYRRVGSKDEVIQAVLAREAQRVIARVNAATSTLPTLDERIATAFATATLHLRQNALFNRMLALDSDTVLPQLTVEATPLLVIAIAATEGLLHQAETDGLLDRISDPEGISEILIRLVHSFVLTPKGTVKLQTRVELEAFARTHLTPIVTRSSRPPQNTTP